VMHLMSKQPARDGALWRWRRNSRPAVFVGMQKKYRFRPAFGRPKGQRLGQPKCCSLRRPVFWPRTYQ
jgi:hypothetical protein